jgi:lipid-binding SYLF domain-containing protein
VLRSATQTLREIQAIPASNVPRGLLAGARAVAIVPNVIKIGFVGSVRHGQGVCLVRNEDGSWGNPIFVSLTGGGIGWQVGIQATDVVLVFNSPESVQGIFKGRFTLGADASVAAGPVGREAAAATDLRLRAEVFSYSRSRGLFAGVALDGSVLAVNQTANAAFYQRFGGTVPELIASRDIPLPPEAIELRALLDGEAKATEPASVPAQVPGASASQPAAVTNPAEIQQQLSQAHMQLNTVLDSRWQQFLALPPEVTTPGKTPSLERLRETLARYDTIHFEAKYQVVSQLPQFQRTYDLLRRYVHFLDSRLSTSRSLNAPPDPETTGPVVPLTPR